MRRPVASVPSGPFTEGTWWTGLVQDDWRGERVFGHPGGNQRDQSFLKVLPERECVLVLIGITPSAFGSFSQRIFEAFGRTVFNVMPAKSKKPATAVRLANPERYVGTYVMLGTTYEITL